MPSQQSHQQEQPPERSIAALLREESSGGKLGEVARSVAESPGAAPLWAAWRTGLKDLQDAVLQAFPDSQMSRDEAGSIGNPTPQLVTEEIRGKELDMEMER